MSGMTGGPVLALQVLALLSMPAAVIALARGQWGRFKVLAAMSNGVYFLADLLQRDWGWAAVNAGVLAAVIGGDWWNRRGRKAARALGGRARAALDGMLERLRESGSPAPGRAPS